MKLLLENWREYLKEDEKFFGSCGMFAIALGEEAAKRGKEVVMVVAHNAEDLEDLLRGEPDVYHIAVEIDGALYDGRGEVSSVDELLGFIGDPSAKVDYLALDEAFRTLVRTQTAWKTTCEEYAAEAERFLDEIGDQNEEHTKTSSELLEEYPFLADDIESVQEWFPAKELRFIESTIKIEKIEESIKEMLSTYEEFPKDKKRTDEIIKVIKQGSEIRPIFIEKNDPHNFVLEGRHRMVANYLLGYETMPVIYVEVQNETPT